MWGTVSNPNVQGVRNSTFPDGKTLLGPGNGFPGQEWFYQTWIKQ